MYNTKKRSQQLLLVILHRQPVGMFYKAAVTTQGNCLCHLEAKDILQKVKAASDYKMFLNRELFRLALIIQIENTLSLLLVATKFFRFQTSSLKYSQHNPSYSLARRFLQRKKSPFRRLLQPASSSAFRAFTSEWTPSKSNRAHPFPIPSAF